MYYYNYGGGYERRMMKKPEKKEINTWDTTKGESCRNCPKQYNQACNEWEKYHELEMKLQYNSVIDHHEAELKDEKEQFKTNLPSEEEIGKIFLKTDIEINSKHFIQATNTDYAKAISERIKEQK